MSRIRKLVRLARLAALEGPAPLRLARRAIREHAALQRTWELAALVAMVRRQRPRTVLEIGTHRGGTLFCWAAVAAPDARLVSVDLPNEREGIGTTDQDRARFAEFLRPGQTLECLRANSQLPETRDRVVAALGGRPVDFLWIDADHRLPGATLDWELYRPLVRPGGLIGFHDIHPNPGFPDNQVDRLWAQIRGGFRVREFIDQDQPGGVGMGIGVLVQPGSDDPDGR
ncbi:MAG TPA: class I SAM-dependent methyltransferase [Longimicrobium sp.]|jgi:predicted O-methyltransferase YrrM|uniref:class I SAM-dependent methyltransferase n=1 Tax=Longimicrobium sp. TaxID=2029185 RepID=UPI002ED91EFC